MAINKKCCFIICLVFLGIGIICIIFSSVIMENLMLGVAKDAALLKEENSDLWAHFPGKSKVNIYQNFYFYNINDRADIPFSNKQIVANEIGPFSAKEITDYDNRRFSSDNTTVGFTVFKYFESTPEEMKKQEDAVFNPINVVSLGVWYQAKNIKQNQVALKALYTIYQGLTNDLYYTAHVKATMQSLGPSVLNQLSYMSNEKQDRLLNDPEYGLFNENFKFMKGILTHPSEYSNFFFDYFDLAFHEMELLKKIIFDNTNVNLFHDRDIKTLGLTQWLDLGVNKNQSIYDELGPEYAQYLRAFNLTKSKLTIEKVLKLWSFNDFNSTASLVDDSASLLNKLNIDTIFNKNYNDSIKFINEQLQINDIEESTKLRGYLDYLSTDVAFRYSKGGSKGIGAISELLHQGLTKFFEFLGQDSFMGIFENKIQTEFFKDIKCPDFVNTYILSDENLKVIVNPDILNKICDNKKINPENLENARFWIENILYKENKLKEYLGLDDIMYTLLKRENSVLKKKFLEYSDFILKKYNVTNGNYKAFNKLKIGLVQWLNGTVTEQTNKTKSIVEWRPDHYKSRPEFFEFCKIYYPEKCNEITLDEIYKIANSENLFNSKFISNLFIEYYTNKNTTNKFAQKFFIDYLRYFMVNEVFDFNAKKSVKDLLWGYEDELLNTVKNTNYFIGGDPSLETKFSFMKNMTEKPEEDNIWEYYTGKGNHTLTRSYKRVMGFDKNKIIMRQKYFDGKKIVNTFYNPWVNYSDVIGGDALSFQPAFDKTIKPGLYLDQLCRSGYFEYYKNIEYLKMKALRYIIGKEFTQNATMNPENSNFYAYKYNGLANVSSVYKAPLFASKPYYYQCDNIDKEIPIINKINYTHSTTEDQDDIDLYNESFVDIEPYSGGVLRAGQKILISALIEKDELFEIEHDKFVPVYYVFRTGNFTEDGIKEVFNDLLSGILFKKINFIFSIFLITLTIAIFIYMLIKIRKEKNIESLEENLMN